MSEVPAANQVYYPIHPKMRVPYVIVGLCFALITLISLYSALTEGASHRLLIQMLGMALFAVYLLWAGIHKPFLVETEPHRWRIVSMALNLGAILILALTIAYFTALFIVSGG